MVKPAAADLLVERPAVTERTVGTMDDVVPPLTAPDVEPNTAERIAGAAHVVDGAPSSPEPNPAAQLAAALAANELFASMREPAPTTAAAKRREKRVQFVDPAVTRAKYDRELGAFRRHEEAYRARGCILIDATFPEIFVMQCVPQLVPAAVLFGVVIDYTNFDAEPPSARIVDTFSKRPLTLKEVWPMPRRAQSPAANPVQSPAVVPLEGDAGPPVPSVTVQVPPGTVLQAWGPDDLPFVCVPGILEYHEHPGHSGDAWLRYRGTGAGGLDAILNIFHTYGPAPVVGYDVEVMAQQLPDGNARIVGTRICGFVPRGDWPT